MSVLYEKGTPAWDIGQLLTRHAVGLPEHKGRVCAIVASLRDSVGQPAKERLARAEQVACTCGKDDSRDSSAGGSHGSAGVADGA
jgi:hypothetical protein